MTSRPRAAACLLVAVLAGCSGESAPDPSATVSGGPVGERVVHLLDLRLPEDGRGVVVAFHPTSDSLTARVPDLPDAGVEVCSADIDGVINDVGCTLVLSSDTTRVPVANSDGLTHVAVVIRSPKGRSTSVDAVDLTYEAADDHHDVDLSLAGPKR